MCGIAGLLNLNGNEISPLVLKSMGDSIKHRGPDGEGQWINKNFGICHRRLSIIDLTQAGKQPMFSQDKRWVLSYNGEIYNFESIKAELKNLNYEFISKCDTEVFLKALIHWGKDALLKFNGMFAFALWDNKKKELLLGRDRYGIKPLYFSIQNNVFSFGSEQKAITAQDYFKKRIDKEALYEYLTFQNIFTHKTLLKNINILPAGHFLTISDENPTPKINQYWDYKFKDNGYNLPKEEYVEELDRLFIQAVNRQLVSDVEMGSYLSGGMDSGSITAIASQSYPNIKTFTCGFDLNSAQGLELSFDERLKAEAMSAFLKTEHYETILKAGDMERCLSDVVFHLEEPRVGQSYPNYYIAKITSKFIKVVLSGTGGDELFGGYPWRYRQAFEYKNFDEYIDSYYKYWQRLVDDNILKKVFKPSFSEVCAVNTKEIFKDVFNGHENSLDRSEDFINNSLYLEAKTFLHGLLIVDDKLSMAHGLESRVPFMDNDLVDFAMKCPVSLKLNYSKMKIELDENKKNKLRINQIRNATSGKQIFRETMKRHIPSEIANAKKQGFSAPDASWFKGDSMNFVKKALILEDSPLYEILDRETLQALVMEHLDGTTNRRLLIWSLLYLNHWIKYNF